MDRIGEPYVTSRRRGAGARCSTTATTIGLGLGFFIAKTLLERSGAAADVSRTGPFPDRGAVVAVRWSRSEFESMPAKPCLLSGPLRPLTYDGRG